MGREARLRRMNGIPRHSNNGNGRALQMPGPAVPIIGQMFELTGFHVMVNLSCRCEPAAPQPLLVTNQAPTLCPKCRKGYVVTGIQQAPNEPPHINVHVFTPQARPDAPAADDLTVTELGDEAPGAAADDAPAGEAHTPADGSAPDGSGEGD